MGEDGSCGNDTGAHKQHSEPMMEQGVDCETSKGGKLLETASALDSKPATLAVAPKVDYSPRISEFLTLSSLPTTLQVA
ncbi:hypothetical protein BELL_0881g00010 [Botrytis elliptica]|uniref:Uncharacterized protein n=1 Tax=Botrytis elliptica TaxID=278938 RepID=A0A4Z1J7Q1_9HELO|nr:hypothetical protein BELL_0881g00010 [Botrytis elliptica]